MWMRSRAVLLAIAIGAAAVAGESRARGDASRAAQEAPQQQVGAGPDLWILSGQSNACGRGRLPGLPASPAVEVFNPGGGTWMPAVDPLPGMGTQGVGPWQAAAVEYAALARRHVRLAGAARGGSSIELWNAADGPVWKSLSGVLDRAGTGAGVFLWYQGEANCGKGHDRYLADFQDLVARVRQGCRNPGMTVVVVQLSAHHPGRALDQEPPVQKRLAAGSTSDVMRMREIQRQCVLSDPNAILVTALGRETQDYWHVSTAGQIELGREIGRALAARLHEVDTAWPGPVLDAAVLGDGGKTVTAHFAEVKQLAGVAAADYCVVGADGPAATIEAVAVAAEPLGHTRIRLTFAAPVKLPARLVYGAGNAPPAALSDEAGNRAPAVQLEITSGQPPDDAATAAPNGAGSRQAPPRESSGNNAP
jgi:hypothetical protein